MKVFVRSHVLKVFGVSWSTDLLFLYHSIRSTLFFLNHLLQITYNHSAVIHSHFENHNVFGNKNKSKVNLYNITSVQYKYLWMITSKNWLKREGNFTFQFHFPIHLLRFSSQSLCLSLSRFPNNRFKLLTVTSETRKYFIHSNNH